MTAELTYFSRDDGKRLDTSSLEAGVALFHLRRKYILDLLNFLLAENADILGSGTTTSYAMCIHKFVNKLTSSTDMVSSALESMEIVENGFAELDEKEKRGNFLGQSQDPQFLQLLKLRRDFLAQEHEALGQVLCGLASNKILTFTKAGDLLLPRLQKATVFDINLIHYLPSIIQLSTSLDPVLTKTTFHTEDGPEVTAFRKILLDSNTEWKLPYLRGTIALVFFTFYSGLFKSGGTNPGVDLMTDIRTPAVKAIDEGAIETLMTIASHSSASEKLMKRNAFIPSLTLRLPLLEVGKYSDAFLSLLTRSLDAFVDGFVSNFAELLREMKSMEEDVVIALANAETDNPDEGAGVDLERFFILVSCLYTGRPELQESSFWSDTESNLYGFLAWASHSQVSFMSAAFCDMLASLCSSQYSANAAFKFLRDPQVLTGASHQSVYNAKARRSQRITWEYIAEALKYYAGRLKPSIEPPTSALSGARVMVPISDVPELEDDAVILLQAYFRLLAEVVRHDPEARNELFADQTFKVMETLFDLLICQSSVVGAALDVVACFAAGNDSTHKKIIWELLDRWAFNSVVFGTDGTVILPSTPARDRLYDLFKTFDDVEGLVHLLDALLQPDDSSEINNGSMKLPYPEDLGSKYRVSGIWPYIDFLINEVFQSSAAEGFTVTEKLSLQLPCLSFIRNSLASFDPDTARLCPVIGVNPDSVVEPHSFINYLRAHPCFQTMTQLFNDKIYTVLMGILSTGIDALIERKLDDPLVVSVLESLKVVNLVLDLQNVFIDVVVKEFRHTSDGGVTSFSTHGLKSFEDAILFDLPVVSHLTLYLSSSNVDIAHESLRLLDKLSVSPQFVVPSSSAGIDSRIRKNRLLSALEAGEESIRVKEGVIEQLDRELDLYECQDTAPEMGGIQIKLELLKFLIANLTSASSEPTISHFLLGFKVTSNGALELDEERGGILSEVSAFESVLQLLQYSLESISATGDIGAENAQLAGVCSEVVRLLCENPMSCVLILDELRKRDVFFTLLSLEPSLGARMQWHGESFRPDNAFFTSPGSQAVVSFFEHRAALLDYLSLELHISAEGGSLSLVSRYLQALVSLGMDHRSTFRSKSAKVLAFLDVLELNFSGCASNELPESLLAFGERILDFFCESNREIADDKLALHELEKMLTLKGLEFVHQKKIASLTDSTYVNAVEEILMEFTKMRRVAHARNAQLQCLSSWTKLVHMLVCDTELSRTDRSTFILETFQNLMPKMMDYSSTDVTFSEQIASLVVSLFSIYEADMKVMSGGNQEQRIISSGDDRTHALFKAALLSLQSPNSTPELRADLYVFCSQYLKFIVDTSNKASLAQNSHMIRSTGDKLLETVCNDAINGDGVCRLVALVLLEVLSTVTMSTKSTFVLDGLVRYNLLLMLVRSMKRTDLQISNRQNLSEGQLFYELSVFKTTMSLLLQIGQERQGANQLIQCGFFNVLQSCEFLNIDPDVGIGAHFGETSTQSKFYELLIPVFQVVAAILLSMGSENEPVIARVHQFLDQHHQLVVSILKKDVLQKTVATPQLDELVKLVVLLISLTNYVP